MKDIYGLPGHVPRSMKPQSLLIIGVLAVVLIAVLAILPPGPAAPQPPGPGEGEPAPAPTPAPLPENGTYINTTYGYAVTCPAGWFFTESGESVWFSSPVKHEEVRINTIPLPDGNSSREAILETLNATYAEDLGADIGAVWVSTEKTALDGIPAYRSVYSVPIVESDRYTFIIRYAVRDDIVYSVMHTVFPEGYDSYNAEAAAVAESFEFI